MVSFESHIAASLLLLLKFKFIITTDHLKFKFTGYDVKSRAPSVQQINK